MARLVQVDQYMRWYTAYRPDGSGRVPVREETSVHTLGASPPPDLRRPVIGGVGSSRFLLHSELNYESPGVCYIQ